MEEKKKKIDFKNNLRIYWQIAKPYWIHIVVVIIFISLLRVIGLGERYIFKIIVDNGNDFLSGTLSRAEFIDIAYFSGAVFLGFIFVSSLITWFRYNFDNKLNAKMVLDLRQRFFDHILKLSQNFHNKKKTGSLISQLSRGRGAIQNTNNFFIHAIAPLVIEYLIVGSVLFILDFWTAFTVVALAFIFVSYSLWSLKRQQSSRVELNMAEDREKGMVADMFTNIDSVKYFGKEFSVIRNYSVLANDAKEKQLIKWDFDRNRRVGQYAISMLGVFAVIFVPLMKFISGDMTIGTLVFIYTNYWSLMFPVMNFVGSLRMYQQGMADFEVLFKYDAIQNDIVDYPSATSLRVRKGEIKFDNVSFAYPEKNERAVYNINLDIKPSEKVALVGHSGSGKTTIVKLLYRLYNLNEGEIKIDGKNIEEFKQESLRSELSIVPQEAILFDDTIYNNILFSRPNATKREVLAAMRSAQLDEFVKNLPLKENTIVGERGVKLSGGEKQRVSIARALLADKKILVLDEATSALDSQTEHEIQKDLARLMKGRTTIIIAHRLSTIMKADKIVVMDKGKIVQVGKHRELIRKQGIYKRLWNLQKGGFIEE